MKKVIGWVKTNKTTVAAILLAVLGYAKYKGWLDIEQTVLITTVLGALGFAVSKDSNKHSTTDQVRKADRKR